MHPPVQIHFRNDPVESMRNVELCISYASLRQTFFVSWTLE